MGYQFQFNQPSVPNCPRETLQQVQVEAASESRRQPEERGYNGDLTSCEGRFRMARWSKDDPGL